MLIHDLLFASAERNPERTAFWLRSGEAFESLAYADVVKRVKALANGLKKLGVAPQTRVGLYAGNSHEWCIIYMAILAAGGVVVPLDPQLKYFELRSIISRSAMPYLFCSESSYADLMELKALVSPYPDVICIEDAASIKADLSLSKLLELGEDAEYVALAVPPECMAVLIFTSGTSGDAKGVMLSHENIVADIEAINARLNIGPDDRFLSVLPLHHTFEATCGFIYPLSIGASIGYVKSLKSGDVLDDIRKLRITVMCGVPLLFEKMHAGIQRALLKKPRVARLYVDIGQRFSDLSKAVFNRTVGRLYFRSLRAKAGLDSVRLFVSGGAAIDPHISRFFNNLGIVLLQGYGLTETSPVLSVNTQNDNDYSSVGQPLPGVEVKILDPNEQGVGEIAAKGKMVMLGYFENPEATRAVMIEGYFATGDLGFIDKKGHIHITGRKKNVIVTPAGKNIYPEEIEAVIDASPIILESAVIPRKRKTGEEPVAVVVPDFEYLKSVNDGRTLPDEEIRRLVRDEVISRCQQLAEYKRIKDVIVMTEELPKTSTRKVKRYILLDTLQKLGEL